MEVSPGNTALDNPTPCQCVFASPSESNINYIHTRFAWLTFSSCFIISDIISAVRQASFFKSRTAQWCIQLLNQFFQKTFFVGLPSYFEALWYPHLYFDRRSNIQHGEHIDHRYRSQIIFAPIFIKLWKSDSSRISMKLNFCKIFA